MWRKSFGGPLAFSNILEHFLNSTLFRYVATLPPKNIYLVSSPDPYYAVVDVLHHHYVNRGSGQMLHQSRSGMQEKLYNNP